MNGVLKTWNREGCNNCVSKLNGGQKKATVRSANRRRLGVWSEFLLSRLTGVLPFGANCEISDDGTRGDPLEQKVLAQKMIALLVFRASAEDHQ